MKLVDIAGLHIEATTGAPLVLLREHDAPHRVVPIFIGPAEADSIALALSGRTASRPLTHDVMAALVESLDAHVDAAEVTDVRDGTFLAELAIHGPTGDQRLGTRPSDAIAMAVRFGAPLFVSDAVLDDAGTLLLTEADDRDQPLDAGEIDAEVAEFRSLLDELDADAIFDAIDGSSDLGGADGDPQGDEPGPPAG